MKNLFSDYQSSLREQGQRIAQGIVDEELNFLPTLSQTVQDLRQQKASQMLRVGEEQEVVFEVLEQGQPNLALNILNSLTLFFSVFVLFCFAGAFGVNAFRYQQNPASLNIEFEEISHA